MAVDLIQYYVDRLILQYRSKPKARGMVQTFVEALMIDDLFGQINDAFSVDTAIGAQLDVIGKYVGIPRNIGDPAALPFFGYWSTEIADPGDQNDHGYQLAGDSTVNADGLYFRANQQGALNTDLTDDAYRFMIKLKIVTNHMDSSLASIDALLSLFFAGVLTVTDNEDMSLSYYYSRLPVSAYTLGPYLPRPMGCSASLSPFSAIATPTSVNWDTPPTTVNSYNTSDVPGVVSTISGGVGPYTYLWQHLSEGGAWLSYQTVALSPTSDTTYFQRFFPYGGTAYSQWRCQVTDAAGGVCFTNPISVTLKSHAPSP